MPSRSNNSSPLSDNKKNQIISFWQVIIKKVRGILPILLALIGGFIIGGILIFLSGQNPFAAYFALLYGAVGDSYNLAATIGRSVPIIGCGVAAGIAFKSGLFNIGAEGQLVLGALCATLIALYFPPGSIAIILAFLVSLVGGGLWGLLSGWFQTRFKVPILISSLLMNYIAVGFVSYMISFPLIEYGGSRNQTPAFPMASRISKIIPGTTVHFGIFITILIVIIVQFVIYKTVAGYELRMFGSNPDFAITGGIKPVRLTLITMLVSGMVAGITGANQVLGVSYRLIDTALTLPGYAWTGVMAAILSNNNPLGIVVASLFFSAIQTGAAGMERATEVPFELSYIIQALMIIFITVRGVLLPPQKKEII